MRHKRWVGMKEALHYLAQVARLPAVADAPGEPPWLVLDGAHTPASAAALVATLGSVFPGRPLALVVGMADDKDHAGFLKELRGAGAQVVVFTSMPIAGAMHRYMPLAHAGAGTDRTC